MGVSIHAPREGSDSFTGIFYRKSLAFQSTLPVKGATTIKTILGKSSVFQSTLPVKGATWRSG